MFTPQHHVIPAAQGLTAIEVNRPGVEIRGLGGRAEHGGFHQRTPVGEGQHIDEMDTA